LKVQAIHGANALSKKRFIEHYHCHLLFFVVLVFKVQLFTAKQFKKYMPPV